MSKRDEFSKPVIDNLAKRAGYLCSNPDCRQPTIGANEADDKSTSIGQAAHITAAAENGPRFNSAITSDERSDISNGIWLCSNCATLIDKDEQKFSVALLHEWKGGVEAESRLKLSGAFKNSNAKTNPDPILEVDFAGQGRGRSPRGYSNRNPIEMHEGQPVMVLGTRPIIHWALNWRYNLVIYNNSNVPAYNVTLENINNISFSEFEQLPKINNIAPLENKSLKIKYEDFIEGVYDEADGLLQPRYPDIFNDNLVLRLTYYDDQRKEYISIVEFQNNEIVNKKIQ